MRRVILCYGVDSWHPRGVDRLERSLLEHDPSSNRMFWREHPHGTSCPLHRDVPYGFKPWAFEQAAIKGFDLALWLDASCWAIAPLEPIWDRISAEGYLVFRGGWSVGTWCSDAALATLNLSREETFEVPMIIGGCIGLDLRDAGAQAWLLDWLRLSRDGVTFQGDWTNDRGQVSADLRVKGHRHDQTAASVLAWRFDWELTDCPWGFSYWREKPELETMIQCQGM